MLLVAFENSCAADNLSGNTVLVLPNAIPRTEVIDVLQEMLGRCHCVRTKEVLMEPKPSHYASFSLNSRISMIGAIFS